MREGREVVEREKKEREGETEGSWLVLSAQSTTKDYTRAEHKLHSISELFISQVIIPQVMFFLFLAYLYSVGTKHGKNVHPVG